MEKEIVIFANSIKRIKERRGRCVAGKDIITKEWIRPVKSNEIPLMEEDTICNNDYELVKPLQIVKIDFLKPLPLVNQPENYLISSKKWTRSGSINRNDINNYLDKPDNLWMYSEKNDRVDYNLIKEKKIQITQSLYLIAVEKIHIYWSEWGQRRGKFEYNNIEYDLAITDPNFEEYKEQTLEDKFLCISLGRKYSYNDLPPYACYKIITSII